MMIVFMRDLVGLFTGDKSKLHIGSGYNLVAKCEKI